VSSQNLSNDWMVVINEPIMMWWEAVGRY